MPVPLWAWVANAYVMPLPENERGRIRWMESVFFTFNEVALPRVPIDQDVESVFASTTF